MRPFNPARILFLAFIFLLSLPGASQAAPELLPNYALTPVAGRLNFPTQLAWLPDGTMLVLEKRGVLKAINGGAARVVADLTASTNDYWDRGMLGLAVDPDFASNHFIYLNRVFENTTTPYAGTKTSQLLRIVLDADGGQMVPGSAVVLVGTSTPRSCADVAVNDDCVPADSSTHSVGDVIAAADGTLYVSNGDGSEFAFNDTASLRAQDIDSLAGKVLHIDRNGLGVPGNPFFTGNGRDNRSKVFAYGMRNPWRLTMNKVTGNLYIADVGSDYFEEINVGAAGANFGWPCYEGQRQSGLAEFRQVCDPLYSQVAQGRASVKAPLAGWLHNNNGAAVVGGTFVNGPSYPASLRGSYIYGDYVSSAVFTLRTDGQDKLVGAPADFARGVTGGVAYREGPDGKLYVLQVADASNNPDTGSVMRLDYEAAGQDGGCGMGQFKAEYFNGMALAGAPALTVCEGAVLDHQWGLDSPGPGVAADNFSVRWTGTFHFDAGDYRFRVSSDDGVRVLVDGVAIISAWHDQGATSYQAVTALSAGNHVVTIEYYEHGVLATLSASWVPAGVNTPPAVTVTKPLSNNLVAVGATVWLEGRAVDDKDGIILAADMQWNVVIEHCAANGCHSHFLLQLPGASGSFTFPDHGQDQYYLEATLIATDAKGVQGSKKIRLDPDLSPGGCDNPMFRGDYFNNQTLSGPPVATVCSTEVNFDWGMEAPAPGVAADHFSARYTRTLPLDAGNYQFTVRGDDGVRFYVDGELLIDAWKDQPATSYTAPRTLAAGDHVLRLEFYDATEDAYVRLSWTK